MSSQNQRGCGAHLIGSVPLADTETVLRTVTAEPGRYLRRISDGKTGERQRWIVSNAQC